MISLKSTKIALIGGSGFIGQHMFKTITKESGRGLIIDKNNVDLTHESCIKVLNKILASHNIDTVVCLAAIKRQDGDSKEILRDNNKITMNTCRALEEASCKVVYFSSCAVYGEKNEQLEIDENYDMRPTSYYGEHKVFSEKNYLEHIDNNRLLIIRPPLIYGWQQKEGYHPGGFMESAKTFNKICLWGDGKEKREFIHVEDAAEITKSLIRNKCYGKVNMVSGRSYSYRSIAENIQEKTNCMIIERERTGSAVNHSYINKKLEEMIGYYKFRQPFTNR
tara:strand:- start:3256 stop:4092 length:837 start_codon:yes stop_codon:yes gene_type:complete